MLLFKKLVDESQMPQSQEYTDTFIITYKLFLVGLQGLYFISNPDGRPCKWGPPVLIYLSVLVCKKGFLFSSKTATESLKPFNVFCFDFQSCKK